MSVDPTLDAAAASRRVWDAVVVGAGPAGAMAARELAGRGAAVLLVDKARFPRYKTCGGGLVGASLAELPPQARAVVERRVRTVSMARNGGAARRRPATAARRRCR